MSIPYPDEGSQSGGSSEGVKVAKKSQKLHEEAKKNNKIRHRESIAKAIGVNLTLSSVLKQSQVFTSTLGSIFQILGALVDVILAPFLPYIVPAIRRMAEWIPRAAKFAQALAERIGPKISQWLGRVFDVIDVFATGFAGSVTEALNKGDWGIIFDFMRDTLVAIKDWLLGYWAELKEKFPFLQEIEDAVKNVYNWLLIELPILIAQIEALEPLIRDLVTQAGLVYLFLKDRFTQLHSWLQEVAEGLSRYIGEWIQYLEKYFDAKIKPHLEQAIEWTKWGFNAVKIILHWGFTKLGGLADAMPVLIEALQMKLLNALDYLTTEFKIRLTALSSLLVYIGKQLIVGFVTLAATYAGGAVPSWLGGLLASGALIGGAITADVFRRQRETAKAVEDDLALQQRAALAERMNYSNRVSNSKMIAAGTHSSRGGAFGALKLGDMPSGFTNQQLLDRATFDNYDRMGTLKPENVNITLEFKNSEAYNDARREWVQSQYNNVQVETNYSKGIIKEVSLNEKLGAYDLRGLSG